MNERCRSVILDLEIYELNAIERSSHRFTGRSFIRIEKHSATQVRVFINPKGLTSDPDSLLGEFINDVLDQKLRSTIAAETEHIRDLIMAHALSETTLLHSDFASEGLKSTKPISRLK